MIERIIQDYLTENGFPTYLSVPEHPSGNFCVVQKTGSGYEDELDSAVLAVQSYGGSQYEAALMNRRVVKTMRNAASLDAIAACDLNTDYDFPDTTRKLPRYQAIFQITYYDD